MRGLRALWMRARSVFQRDRVESEFSAELDAHIAMHTEAGVEAGLNPADARRQALLRLGGKEQVQQAHRGQRGILWIENLVQDVRYGVRTLLRTPGFTLTAVLTVGLGVGACTAIFSLVNAVLIRSLPYGDPERLVYLFSPNPALKIPAEVICPSYGDFYDLKREAQSFVSMSNFEQAQFSVIRQGNAQHIGGARVDEDFFSTLESMPELGRTFTAEENRPAHAKVAVISHSLWVSMFGSRADVLQHFIELDGVNYQIVGVMQPKFEYPFSSDLPYGDSHIKSTQVWVPLALDAKARSSRGVGNNISMARLRPGGTMHEAQAEMSAIMHRLDQQYASDPRDAGIPREWGALVESFTGISVGPVRPLMRLLLAAVGLVLLIACGNAANLLIARAAERSRELGIRVALGSGRSRMVRQLLTEALLVGLGGCLVGVVLAYLFLRLLPSLDPGNIPRLNEASLDARVLAVAIGASLLTSLIAGLMPAILASRKEVGEFLKSAATRGGATGQRRLQSVLIVAQTATVVVLLASAGLLIRSYINVQSVDTGFSQSTFTFHVALDQHYKPEQRADFFRQLIVKLKALPGVESAGAVNDLPLTNSESISFVWIDGFTNQAFEQSESRTITPQYFVAMHTPLVAGRHFSDADTAGDRPVIVNQKFADTFFSNRNPIGGRISTDDKHAHWATVIGVVSNVRHMGLEEDPQPQIYVPAYDFDSASIAVRSSLPPSTIASEAHGILRSIDPSVALTDTRTMGDLVSTASARRRFQTSLLTAFAAIALLLALIGLYGLMAFSVNRRTREVGIRMALGAERRDVLLLVLKNATVLVASGLAAGLVCTWIVTRALRSFLFEVSAHDPLTVLVVSLLLVICGLIAAFVPARRAASVDPMQALRTE